MILSRYMSFVALGLLWITSLFAPGTAVGQPGDWHFTVAGDMRRYVIYQDIHGWDQACQAIAAAGPGAFMVSPGDLDQQYTSNPGDWAYQFVESEIAPGFPFFPGVGNHELDDIDTMNWIRGFDHGGPGYDVNPGPAGSENTTYSWDEGDAHFVMLNLCFDGADDMGSYEGTWNPALDAWLDADLAASDRALTFVFGHFPAYPQSDRDTGLGLHLTDNDFNMYNGGEYRDALWSILKAHGVTAYVCGHSHTTSALEVEGVWQVDMGHARGPRDPNYHGPSTFLRFMIGGDRSVVLETWRQPFSQGPGNEQPYTLWHTDTLKVGVPLAVGEAPSAARIDRVWPNPFNPSLNIRVTGASAGAGRLEIIDLGGRVVRVLHRGALPTGSRDWVWDGRDDAGRPLPSGTYRVTVGDGVRSDTRSVSLIR